PPTVETGSSGCTSSVDRSVLVRLRCSMRKRIGRRDRVVLVFAGFDNQHKDPETVILRLSDQGIPQALDLAQRPVILGSYQQGNKRPALPPAFCCYSVVDAGVASSGCCD